MVWTDLGYKLRESLYGPNRDPQCVAKPDVRDRPLRDAAVDGRAVDAERVGDLSDSKWNDAADLDVSLPYQGRTKPAAKTSIPHQSVANSRPLLSYHSKSLRSAASHYSPGSMDCHAGGQGFESPTPRSQRGRNHSWKRRGSGLGAPGLAR